jgi:hypothetical protein
MKSLIRRSTKTSVCVFAEKVTWNLLNICCVHERAIDAERRSWWIRFQHFRERDVTMKNTSYQTWQGEFFQKHACHALSIHSFILVDPWLLLLLLGAPPTRENCWEKQKLLVLFSLSHSARKIFQFFTYMHEMRRRDEERRCGEKNNNFPLKSDSSFLSAREQQPVIVVQSSARLYCCDVHKIHIKAAVSQWYDIQRSF